MEDKLTRLEDVTKVQLQDGNWNYSPYMQGMANGLLLAVSIMKGTEPDFVNAPEQWLQDQPVSERGNNITLVSGDPVPADNSHTEINPRTGQQKDYVVLSEEERAKGFVRPYRDTYTHVGKRPPSTLRDLTDDEKERHPNSTYVKYEEYPEDKNSPVVGRYWTQAQLDSIGGGCGTDTRMSPSIAETYAREPGFYRGTFCAGCKKHLPLDEFVWKGTNEQVGS